MRLLGNIEARTDSKGRVFLPSVFRKVLQASGEEALVLRKDVFQPCLVLYPQSVWDWQLDELKTRLNRWNPEHQQMLRQFVYDVEMITLDSNGRFIIPKRYQELANIESGVRFIGMDDTIEIWGMEQDMPLLATEDFGERLTKVMTNQ